MAIKTDQELKNEIATGRLTSNLMTDIVDSKSSRYEGIHVPSIGPTSTNIESLTFNSCIYLRTGNSVLYTGSFDIDVSLNDEASFLFDLPSFSGYSIKNTVNGYCFSGVLSGSYVDRAGVIYDNINEYALVTMRTINETSPYRCDFNITYLLEEA